MSKVLAADVGGTNLRLALIDEDGAVADQIRVEARLSKHSNNSAAEAKAHIIETLSNAITPLLRQHSIDAVGIGFPGFFRGTTGVLASSPNLPMIIDFPLAECLSDSLGITTTVQNDALCAAMGEFSFGAGRDRDDLLHITLGTGVGGGLILNRAPYSGEHGMAMEFGHLTLVESGGRSCGCGNTGCLEAYASASAVAARFKQASGIEAESKTVYDLACTGDQQAITILKETGHYLGRAIAEAIKLLDIRTVTISGGLTNAWDLIHPSMVNTLNNHLIPPLRGEVDILRSTLDDQAGILGAAAFAGQTCKQ